MINPLTIIRTYIAANAGLTALVSTRIYWGTTMPAGYTVDAGPAILMNTRGGGQDYTSKVLQPTISFQCIAGDDLAAFNVAKALYDALNDKQTYSIMEARQTTPPQLIFDQDSGFHIALVYYECQIRNP
jgi:hypothetical protein